jgi:transcription initiation factor TFIIE subunit alpha
MEVLDNYGVEGFLCHTCGSVLNHDLELTEAGHEQSTRLNNQFKFITDILPQIDAVRIPDNTFDVAFGNKREVRRDATNPAVASIVVDGASKRPTAVHGLQNTGPKTMSVNIASAEGLTETERAEEKARKEKIAQQNALPSWMSNSTITGESFKGNNTALASAQKDGVDVKDSALKESADDKQHAELDDLMARLKEQRAAEANKRKLEDDEDGSDDEEDDGAFEDVVAPSASHTPAPTYNPVGKVGASPAPLKRSSDDIAVDGAGEKSAVNEEEKQIKKVKVETPPAEANGDRESEDELEFEDV